MIGLEDRQALAQDIEVAHAAGARLRPACEVAGIDLRTLQRWKLQQDPGGALAGDGRPQALRPMPGHALNPSERQAILDVANEPRFADVPPARIVPMLADEGTYLASESSFARVLRAHGQNARRGRAKAPKASRPPTTHIATAARQVWCWDMTYLPALVMGRWFHLYLILDLYSRKIVGWEVHDSDDADHAVQLLKRTALAEGIAAMASKPVLHGDNGSTLKATTRTPGRGSATTTPSPRACSAPPSTARSSLRRASPIWAQPGSGPPRSCVGTTTITVTAASATSAPPSGMLARIERSWLHGTRCTSRPSSATQRDGPARPATGPRSAPSRSTLNATRWSPRPLRLTILSPWLRD